MSAFLRRAAGYGVAAIAAAAFALAGAPAADAFTCQNNREFSLRTHQSDGFPWVSAELQFPPATYGLLRARTSTGNPRDPIGPGPWERFRLRCLSGGEIAILGPNNLFVTAEQGSNLPWGVLRARAASPGPWERFTFHDWRNGDASGVLIRSEANGRYVAAELSWEGAWADTLRARTPANALGPWEMFRVVF